MDHYIRISNLNDFLFCPVSIFFHNLMGSGDRMEYQSVDQINGSNAHSTLDHGRYTTSRKILQGTTVFCENYGLIGKIDLFDTEKGLLTERKNCISQVYDGQIFQMYAQYYALTEMGYAVRSMRLYSMKDNKIYPVKLPTEDSEKQEQFEKVIIELQDFHIDGYQQSNLKKCRRCIYEPICGCEGVEQRLAKMILRKSR